MQVRALGVQPDGRTTRSPKMESTGPAPLLVGGCLRMAIFRYAVERSRMQNCSLEASAFITVPCVERDDHADTKPRREAVVTGTHWMIRGDSRSSRPIALNISMRTRSATALTTSAPSCDGSTWMRKGRLPCGRSTARTICRATSSGSASAGSRLASPLSVWSVTPA